MLDAIVSLPGEKLLNKNLRKSLMETLTGTVSSIVYAGAENGFTVAKIESDNGETIIIGTLPSLQPGECLKCQGTWKKHAQYGKQFEVSSFESHVPSDLVGIKKYLESGMIKGIGPSYAKKIVGKFGLNTLKIINEEPSRLSEVGGIGPKRLKTILKCWEEQHAIRDIMIFLRGHGVGAAYAHKIYKIHKENSIEKVQNDPFSLTRSIQGIGFKTADKIAESVGIAKESPQRIDAGIEFVFQELAGAGHTCYPEEEFLTAAETILEVSAKLVASRISFLLENGSLSRDNGKLWVRLFYLAEQGIAKEVIRLSDAPSSLREVDEEKAIEWVQEKLRLTLAKEQREAVYQGVGQKFMVITGGPGTGKSTITKAILRISEKLTSKILLAAPTGRAAKRMSEITYKKAFTIHSILEMDFISGTFKKNQDNPLSCDLLIIDEASMIDTRLMQSLLRAVPDHCRVILIGDVDQLPSVGAGNVLKDIIEAEVVPVFQLKRIFRQAANSRIITNAHRVNRGYMPDLTPIPGSDFLFLAKELPEEILDEVLHQVQQGIFTAKGRTQVLSPMKKGILGTENLNALLQKTLNPSTKPLIRMGKCFHLYDKVMQIKNNYEKEVYNGDIGFITKIDLEEEQMEVSFDNTPVIYEFSELTELILAYAVSIHKYQGSECDRIILPIHTSHFKLLNKNLLYTGITRGKKQVVLIGTQKAVILAVKKAESDGRYTGLKEQLTLSLTNSKKY
jgi:exodeoxyribonuclease V alpha subunit